MPALKPSICIAAVLPLCVTTLFGGQASPAERAISVAKQAISKEPDKSDGYNALAMALARRARETADTAYYRQAEDAVKRSLALTPDNFEGLKARCWILLGRYEFREALALARQLNRRMPDDAAVYGFLTDAHAGLGNYKEAEESAQWMLDLSRAVVPALTRAAYLRELFGDPEGALELLRTAYSRINPLETEDRAWTLVRVAHLLRLTGKLADAGIALHEALQLVPDYPYALAGLAKVRTAESKHDEAAQLMRRRYELAPHPANLFDLASHLHRAGRRMEAVKAFAKFEKLALAESGASDNANRELILYYADYARRPAEALKLARLEIARRRDVVTLDAYAWALHRSGLHRDANDEISKALAVGTLDPEIRAHARSIEAAAAARAHSSTR